VGSQRYISFGQSILFYFPTFSSLVHSSVLPKDEYDPSNALPLTAHSLVLAIVVVHIYINKKNKEKEARDRLSKLEQMSNSN